MDSIEQRLMLMLQQLPISVTITWRDGLYSWQCFGRTGTSPDLVGATEQALRTMIELLATNAGAVAHSTTADTSTR